MTAMRALHRGGAEAVIVSRATDPLLILDAQGFAEVTQPRMSVADTRGAGDSLTAGVAAAMVRGERPRDAVVTGAAAGALNVTRHGLGTGDADTIAKLRESVTVREIIDDSAAHISQPVTGHVSPDGLAALAEPEDQR
jgi:1-phosphofructokinase